MLLIRVHFWHVEPVCTCFSCAGLSGCSRLQQLHISGYNDRHLSWLPACRVLRQLTELRLWFRDCPYCPWGTKRSLTPILELVAADMSQLVKLDISHNDLRSACSC